MHEELVSAEFQLYLFFLKGQLPIIAGINAQLQKCNQDLYTTYQKIKCFTQTFLEPVLIEQDQGIMDGNIRPDIIIYPGEEFMQFREKSLASGLITESQLHIVMQNVFDFVITTGQALKSCFPEMSFVLQNLIFLNPDNRKFARCDIGAVIAKYSKGRIDSTAAKLQYSIYRNYDTLDFMLLRCENKHDRFFCKLAKITEYDQLGKLALELLCMSPDTVDCERGFSHMNLTKTKYAGRLSQENLERRMVVYMDDRSIEVFPFSSVSSCI